MILDRGWTFVRSAGSHRQYAKLGHALTDPAFLVLTAAYIVFYLRFTRVPAYFGWARTLAAPQSEKGVAA